MLSWIPIVAIAMGNRVEEVMGMKYQAAVMLAADFVHPLHVFVHIQGNGADICLAKGINATASVETILAVPHISQIIVQASQIRIA